MPTLLIKTNATPEGLEALMKDASAAVAAGIGKPEKFVMVEVQPGCRMIFGGTAEPCAFLHLASVGKLGPEVNPVLSGTLCKLMAQHCGV